MSDVTRILSQIDTGDPAAAEQLLPLVYDELRKLAGVKLAQEKPGQTLPRNGRDIPSHASPRSRTLPHSGRCGGLYRIFQRLRTGQDAGTRAAHAKMGLLSRCA